jgi:hypothetical protein
MRRSIVTQAARRGFYAKERGIPVRVNLGIDGQLWVWRTDEDVRAGRCLWVGQETVASSGQDAASYCAVMRVRGDRESDEMLEYLNAVANKRTFSHG